MSGRKVQALQQWSVQICRTGINLNHIWPHMHTFHHKACLFRGVEVCRRGPVAESVWKCVLISFYCLCAEAFPHHQFFLNNILLLESDCYGEYICQQLVYVYSVYICMFKKEWVWKGKHRTEITQLFSIVCFNLCCFKFESESDLFLKWAYV